LQISDNVRVRPERYSIIPVPNPFVVPGGRFREIYYWDSFFIIKGLLASHMYVTVRGMIENMQYLIETRARTGPPKQQNHFQVRLRTKRQPYLLSEPLTAPTTYLVRPCLLHGHERSWNLWKKLLPTLRKEMAFFQANRSVIMEGWPGPLYRYRVVTDSPRPESYREDIESAAHLHEEADKQRLWGDIAAAAESGRDFSSRWFGVTGPFAGKLASTRTSEIVPVDLNAIICGNLQLMGDLYDAIGDIDGSKWCAQSADLMKQTIHQVLWNETAGCWFDYDIKNDQHIRMFSDTNFFPMYTKATHATFNSERVVDYLRVTGVLEFPGGVPSSLVASGEQWDFPNAWAPTMWILIEGLRLNGQKEIALQITEKWVRKNFNMWRASGGKMYEKYNVVSACYKIIGGGGEYEMQEGFGWTNGVLLDLLVTYGNQLTWSPAEECECCVLDCICLV
ncbi:alpha,alpha-trehalase, partial [Oesophagostomum dentatum]